MSAGLYPIARIRSLARVSSVAIRKIVNDTLLSQLCCRTDGTLQPYQGNACIYVEYHTISPHPCVRLEIEGKTIGYLELNDAIRYQKKLDYEALEDCPIIAPIQIQPEPESGYPFPQPRFTVNLFVNLNLSDPWEFDSLLEWFSNGHSHPQDQKKDKQSGEQTESDRPVRSRHQMIVEIMGRKLAFLLVTVFCSVSFLILRGLISLLALS